MITLMILILVTDCQKNEPTPEPEPEVTEPSTREDPKPVLGGWKVNSEVTTPVYTAWITCKTVK